MRYEVKEGSGNLMMEKSFYWLRLLFASKYLTARQFSSLHADCEELIRILGSTQLTMKTKLQKEPKS